MKLRLLTIPVSLLLAFTLFFVSCSKTGPVGPAGTTGAAGAQGPAGTAGLPGPKGDTGTANVIYSPWLNVTFQVNTATNPTTGKLDTTGYSAQIAAIKLTDSIVKTGEIKVYVNLGSDSTSDQFIAPLPYFDGSIIINPYFASGTIQLISNINVSSYVSNTYNHLQYRYILIPGGVRSGRYAPINWKDYQQVKKYLRLKD